MVVRSACCKGSFRKISLHAWNTGYARSVKRITDPRALRALAHPIRMSLIGLLRTEGPLTATRPPSCSARARRASFHLRQLAKYGMAEEAPGGQGRERPWQATTMSTDVPDFPDDPELAAAGGMYRAVLAERYFEWLKRWLEPGRASQASGSAPTRSVTVCST